MVSVMDLTILGVIAVGLHYFFKSKKKYNLPPGPWNIPFISGCFVVGKMPHLTFQQWAKKHGPLITTKFGLANALIIDDAKLMREAFNDPAFNGRMDHKAFTVFSQGKHGILNAEGQEWSEQRRFVLRTLREFGFGKQSMEEFIMEEIHEFLKWMKTTEGVPTEMHPRLVLATINSLWTIMTGQRHDHDDEALKRLNKRANESFNEVGRATGLWILFPQLTEILPKIFLKDWYHFLDCAKQVLQIFQNAITDHIQNPVSPSEPRDLIDVYLTEIKNTTDPNSSFYGKKGQKTLLSVLSDLYGAGQSTTSQILAWSVLYLVRFPNVQKKLQKELDTVVGRNRLPTAADRPNLPFTEAFMMEIFRHVSLAPLGLFHETTEDTKLGGYDIPKGTVVIPNVYSKNYNKETYGDPENFRPERYLSADEKTVLKDESLMPFGTGKRLCLGEKLGRDNYFLFITSIFQRFEIKADPSKPLPSLDAQPGFFRDVQKFHVIFNERFIAH